MVITMLVTTIPKRYLIQNVKVTGYDYWDESQNYTNNNINNAPFMNIYENWTKNKQLGIN